MLNQIYRLIFDAVQDALRSGEDMPTVPNPPHEPRGHYLFATDLSKCPLALAKELRGETPRFPALAEQRNWVSMRIGVKLAEIYQEALLWKYGFSCPSFQEAFADPSLLEPTGTYAWAEVPLRNDVLDIRGRADLILFHEGEWHVIDIKTRDVSNPAWEVKYSDFLQLYTYRAVMHKRPTMHVLSITSGNWDAFNLWTYDIVAEEAFRVYNQEGREWNSPDNAPHRLNHRAWGERLLNVWAYVDGALSHQPIDPMRDDEGWMCYQKDMRGWPKPTKSEPVKTVQIRPRCPFACESIFPRGVEELTVEVTSEGRQIVMPIPF